MAASEQIVEFVSTSEIELFLPLMREIDFSSHSDKSSVHRRSTSVTSGRARRNLAQVVAASFGSASTEHI
jgi:hypothetical protein